MNMSKEGLYHIILARCYVVTKEYKVQLTRKFSGKRRLVTALKMYLKDTL